MNIEARYKSMKKLLMQHLEQDPALLWALTHRDMLDVWNGWIESVFNLAWNERYKTWVSATGGSQLLTGNDFEAQTGHNDFPIYKNAFSNFFSIINDADVEGSLYVGKGFLGFMFFRQKALSRIN